MSNKAEWLSGASTSSLQDDIIAEILSWLPVVSLLRFKCICKSWRDIIERDDEFMEKHHRRAATCFCYKYKHMQDKYETPTAVFSCIDTQKGLVLEQDSGAIELGERLRIRNPATRQAVYLPDAAVYWMLAGMFFVGKNCCKVIGFSQAGNSILEGRFRAITVGVDAAWRPLNNSSPSSPNYLLRLLGIPLRMPRIYALSIGNVFHVVTMDNDNMKILSVNVEDDERCESEEIPETLFSDWSNVKPSEWDSKLSLYSQNGGNINICVLQKNEWVKTTIVVDYPVSFIAEDAKCIYRCLMPFTYCHWSLPGGVIKFKDDAGDGVVAIKPTILKLKGMEAVAEEADIDDRPYWKEEDVLIPSSQIISLLSLHIS